MSPLSPMPDAAASIAENLRRVPTKSSSKFQSSEQAKGMFKYLRQNDIICMTLLSNHGNLCKPHQSV